MDRLFLSYAMRRTLFGNTFAHPKSRFLEEMPSVEVHRRRRARCRVRRAAAGAKSRFTRTPARASGSTCKLGDRVRHPKWGEGLVVGVAGAGGDGLLTIIFPNVGQKMVMLKYAPLEKVVRSSRASDCASAVAGALGRMGRAACAALDAAGDLALVGGFDRDACAASRLRNVLGLATAAASRRRDRSLRRDAAGRRRRFHRVSDHGRRRARSGRRAVSRPSSARRAGPTKSIIVLRRPVRRSASVGARCSCRTSRSARC